VVASYHFSLQRSSSSNLSILPIVSQIPWNAVPIAGSDSTIKITSKNIALVVKELSTVATASSPIYFFVAAQFSPHNQEQI
jgi:hypothetical protein